jgi:hypothetical protein
MRLIAMSVSATAVSCKADVTVGSEEDWPMVTVEATAKSAAAPTAEPAQVEVKENSWLVGYAPHPSAIVATVQDDVTWPWFVNHVSVDDFSGSIGVEIDPHDLIRTIAFDSEFWVPISNIVSQLKDCAEFLVPFFGELIEICVERIGFGDFVGTAVHIFLEQRLVGSDLVGIRLLDLFPLG